MSYEVSSAKLLQFIAYHQIVAESAKGLPIPSLVQYIVGDPYKGSWWSLENSSRIYNALLRVREDPSLLVCKLFKKKITFLHEASWPALVSLAKHLPDGGLDKIREDHGEDGKHHSEIIPMKIWWNAVCPPAWEPLSDKDALLYLDYLKPGLASAVITLY